MSEDKHEKFMRLAENRTNDVMNKLRLIGNLSNKRNYEYSDEEYRQIFKAIENELKVTKKKFETEIRKEDKKFKFDR